jgi:mRNA-degrading endonuclease toxin of MazEF toxin-antitoxin module
MQQEVYHTSKIEQTSPQPSPPILVPLECAGQRVLAVTDQIRAVTKERLSERMGEISASDLLAAEAAVRRILELG